MSEEQLFTHDTYLSPFTWRYGSAEMRRIWSEKHKRLLWRRIWVALASAQQGAGLVEADQVDDLRAHAGDVDLARAQEIEREIHHDLMAEIRTYAEQCPIGGGVIHLGATSMDIEDNADAMRILESLDVIITRLQSVIFSFAEQVERWADVPTMAFTHLQPAEPTTVGYRLAQTLQDLDADYREVDRVRRTFRGKGLKGAAGTSASYTQLLVGTELSAAELEARVMTALGLEAVDVATQTYPRKQDYRLLAALAGLGATLYKFAFDLRVLQSPPIGEWSEPFAAKQVGSSAMPFKRNPINAENIDSLARMLAGLPRVAWDNAAHSLLERTLDDSANRRSTLPEAFLIADELLRRAEKLITGLQIDRDAAQRLLATYGGFAATERLLMEGVKRGANRQELHEVIRERSLAAWDDIRQGKPNPLVELLCADGRIRSFANETEVRSWMDPSDYVGDAPTRAKALAEAVRARIPRER